MSPSDSTGSGVLRVGIEGLWRGGSDKHRFVGLPGRVSQLGGGFLEYFQVLCSLVEAYLLESILHGVRKKKQHKFKGMNLVIRTLQITTAMKKTIIKPYKRTG